MKSATPLLLVLLLVTGWSGSGQGQQGQPPAPGGQNPSQTAKRFEYKYSFKPPYLAQKDGTVPFFTYFGNAIASEESVRITPSLRSQKGSIWGKLGTQFEWWEVEIHFRVTGRGRIGADGLAFWFTQAQGREGPVFGSVDRWNGLGLFFDSFDNDNKHNNPYVMAMVNDGTKNYDHQNDGSTQQLAGCLRDFRNKPFPVKAKVEYFKNVLTVLFHNGMSNNDRDFEVCLRAENVFLPKSGFFGISAATGGLADDHDVLKFTVHSLRSPEMALVPDAQFNEEESKKFEEEFEQYQTKLKDQKEQWARDNPEAAAAKQDPDDWDNWFSEQDKELQQIYQGQSDMKDTLNDLHAKMDEIIGRQERTLAVLAAQGGGQVAAGGGGGGQPQIPVDTIRRDEVNAVLANQREIVTASRDIKNFVIDIHQKTGQILSQGSGGSVQQVSGQPSGGAPYDLSRPVQEMKESLNIVRREIGAISQKVNQPQQQVQCPEVGGGPTNCVSTMVFVGLMFLQLVIMISYLMYRDSKEAQAKKFY